jgi:hypothetical protein
MRKPVEFKFMTRSTLRLIWTEKGSLKGNSLANRRERNQQSELEPALEQTGPWPLEVGWLLQDFCGATDKVHGAAHAKAEMKR